MGKKVETNFLASPIESITMVGSEEKSSLKITLKKFIVDGLKT